MVYVLDLASSSVELGGRCWVANNDYWVARCDLLEKTKLRFDNEGIRFAFPQLDLHINSRSSAAEEAALASMENQWMQGNPEANES
jgi:small conductance mechanosensitive channel